MPATDCNDPPALLGHLARLQRAVEPAEGTSTSPQNLRWAKQVYNAAVRLQFCFVYPDTEIANRQLHTDFGHAIEHLIDHASNAVVPLREHETPEKLDELLDRETRRELDAAISGLLAVAGTESWVMGTSPADTSDFERGVDLVANLAAWHQGRREGEPPKPLVASGIQPSLEDDSKADFIASLALKLAVERSPVIARIPTMNARVFRDVAEAFFSQSVSDLGDSGGDQQLQAIAENVRRSQAKEGA
jgi:hypothetical protein